MITIVVDARLERRVDDREDLVAAEMAGREQHPVAGDHREHLAQLGQHGAVVVDDRHGRDLDPLLAQLELELDPHRHLGARRAPRARATR